MLRSFLAAIFAMIFTVSAHAAESVNVFAAASLKNALDAVATAWQARSGHEARMVYAASSALAKQIAEGAPADIFISADEAWMDDVEGKALIDTASRYDLLGNTLVLIAPASSSVNVTLAKPLDLTAVLAGCRIAVADVAAVPAGKYAKAALTVLGAWDSVQGSLAQAENVRAALALVARGEAPLGIVYGSDAAVEPQVRVVAEFPSDSHPEIVYPVARVAASANPNAGPLLDFLKSPEAQSIFAGFGFKTRQ